MPTYLIVHDARKDGLTDSQIVKMLWGSPGLLDSSWIVEEHLKRAQWFITTGLDLSRFCVAPSARLGHFTFERDRAFPAQC